MTPWEEKLVRSGLDGETNKCTSVTEAIKAAGWKEKTCVNIRDGPLFFTEEGQRRTMLPLEVQKNVHYFKKGGGEAGREATAEINRQLREFIAAGRPESARTGLSRIIMVHALYSHEAMTPARLMSEQELREWLATDPKTAAKYDSTKHVGVVLLCWKGEHVYCLAHRKHCCRVSEADLRAMLDRWMEHYGSKPSPTGLRPLGLRLQDHRLLMSFAAALGWALGLKALGAQALVPLTAPITNEGVLPFSPQELSNPWGVEGSEGSSLATLKQDLPGLEEQLVTERTHESQRSASFKTVAVGLWHLKRQGLLELPRLPVRAKRHNPHVPPTPDSRAATGGGAGSSGAKRYKPSPSTPRQQPQPHTGGQDESKPSQGEEEKEQQDKSKPPPAPGPLAMQGLMSGITTLLGKLAQALGQDVTTVSPPLQGALAFLTTLQRKGLVASESDLQYGDTIVTQALKGAVEQLLQPLRTAQDTQKARKDAVAHLLRQHPEVHKQCFPAQFLNLDKLFTGLEALKKRLQDATAKRDQAQRDMQAQAVAVSEAQALVIASPVLQAEVRQLVAKLQSQCAVLTDKLRPQDSSVARLQAAHDALGPAIQQWKSAVEECVAVRARVNAAPLETLHTELQQHWASLRHALTQ